MKKLNKVAMLFAAAALAAPLSSALAQSVDNWRATDGTVWKNGTNELCWRDANWTPATGVQGCDGVPAPAAPAPAPALWLPRLRPRLRSGSGACRPDQRKGHLRC
jgi:OOP family OmpA-OmpF porin